MSETIHTDFSVGKVQFHISEPEEKLEPIFNEQGFFVDPKIDKHARIALADRPDIKIAVVDTRQSYAIWRSVQDFFYSLCSWSYVKLTDGIFVNIQDLAEHLHINDDKVHQQAEQGPKRLASFIQQQVNLVYERRELFKALETPEPGTPSLNLTHQTKNQIVHEALRMIKRHGANTNSLSFWVTQNDKVTISKNTSGSYDLSVSQEEKTPLPSGRGSTAKEIDEDIHDTELDILRTRFEIMEAKVRLKQATAEPEKEKLGKDIIRLKRFHHNQELILKNLEDLQKKTYR